MNEWRTVDKSDWPRGPWDDEPDKAEWRDEATGLPCLIVRSGTGALCGYVGLPPQHPWHGASYQNLGAHVHGGLTFSGPCDPAEAPETGICHVPLPGESDDVWWLGFDCGHVFDRMPAFEQFPGFAGCFGRESTYRDFAYIRAEVTRLAAQTETAHAR